MTEDNTISRKRVRSPSYPSISLDTAIQKLTDFHSAEGRNESILAVGIQHFGYSPTSGSGQKALAALSSFGLIDVAGTGPSRRVKVSELALRILLDDRVDSEDRDKNIKKAALLPKIHQKLWDRWGKDLPSSENMRHTLIFDYKFNEKCVADFIREYQNTIEFAGLLEDTLEVVTVESELTGDDDDPETEELYETEKLEPAPKPQQMESQSRSYSQSPSEIEIAMFPVGKSTSIKLIGSGEITKKSIEALVAQLSLAIQIGTFDDE